MLNAAAYPKTRRGLGLHSYSWTEPPTKPAGMKQMVPLFGDERLHGMAPARKGTQTPPTNVRLLPAKAARPGKTGRRFAGAGEGNGVGLQANENRPTVEKGVL